MYPESFLWWLGGIFLLFGIIGLIGMLAWWVDTRYQKHIEKHHNAPKRDEDTPDVSSFEDNEHGRTVLWLVFEVLSAIFVVTGLLVAIYSDSVVLRAAAGIAMIVLVAAATWSVLERQGGK